MFETPVTVWHRASACHNAACVEVASIGEAIAVRDSKAPAQGHLLYTRAEWQAFLAAAKAGEFDHLGN